MTSNWYAMPFTMRYFIVPGHPRLVTVQRNWPFTTGYDIEWHGRRINEHPILAGSIVSELRKVVRRLEAGEEL